MWRVEGPVDEEGLLLVAGNEIVHLSNHAILEKEAVFEDVFAVSPKVMPIGPLPEEEVGIVVDAASHVSPRMVESLVVGHSVRRVSKMPLPDMAGGIARCLHHLGDGHFA